MVCDYYSKSHTNATYRLNPYSIGIWSATAEEKVKKETNVEVLILILLEYGLRQGKTWVPLLCVGES